MNNQQFRRLVLDTPSQKSSSSPANAKQNATPALGSRARSSIPMTPRSISSSSYSSDFTRQLAESQRPVDKKFKSSAAPKGTKLAKGYVDRTQLRRGNDGEEEESDDKAERVKALEDLVHLGQIDGETFHKLRKEITGEDFGGSVSTTHLVKGLDWKLLERARRGEDVYNAPTEKEEETKDDPPIDVDEEFEKLEEKEVVPIAKEEREKKGAMAPPPPVAGKKRTRDEILKELKASRAAAAVISSQPSLGNKFRRIGERDQEELKRFVETDEKGRRREVMITIDEDGRQKRKVRYLREDELSRQNGLDMPDKDAKPLGMEIPEYAKPPTGEPEEAESDGDIFEGVGVDYDPLGGDDDSDSSSDSEEGVVSSTKGGKENTKDPESVAGHKRDFSASVSPTKEDISLSTEPHPSKTRNYFGASSSEGEPLDEPPNQPFSDPTILAAIKKASAIHSSSTSSPPEEASGNKESLLRRKKMLESAAFDRDAQDMDMGFGSSKFGDDEDESFVGGKGKGGRKRGPKKRKGDKDSASDVLGVLEK